MELSAKYMIFYLHGHEDDLLDDDDVDVDELVDQALRGGPDPRAIAMKVAQGLAGPLRHDREKRDWIKEHRGDIKEAGGDEQLAFEHYVAGRVDQYARSLEGEIIEGMIESDDDDDDEEDDDEDED